MENIKHDCVKYFPVTLFSTVMGIIGLGIVLLKVAHLFHFSPIYGKYVIYAVTIWFIYLNVMYLIKWLKYSSEVAIEFNHPVRMNFFPAYSICLLLIAIAYLPINKTISTYAWWIGAPLHLFLLLRTLYSWFHKEYQLQTFNPAWFIPVVGPILVPVAGTKLAHPEISWFFFSIGIIYWIVLLAILMNRVIFHHPIPAKLIPTFFILIAPAAVGFIAYVKMTGNLDVFARILFYFGLFTVLMLLTMIDKFAKVPFFVSWWAYTFPLDAFTLSSILMYEKSHFVIFKILSGVFAIITLIVILIVFFKTMQAAMKKEICIPE